jgi:hypothetical protein
MNNVLDKRMSLYQKTMINYVRHFPVHNDNKLRYLVPRLVAARHKVRMNATSSSVAIAYIMYK